MLTLMERPLLALKEAVNGVGLKLCV
jgi:hypothetical protein